MYAMCTRSTPHVFCIHLIYVLYKAGGLRHEGRGPVSECVCEVLFLSSTSTSLVPTPRRPVAGPHRRRTHRIPTKQLNMVECERARMRGSQETMPQLGHRHFRRETSPALLEETRGLCGRGCRRCLPAFRGRVAGRRVRGALGADGCWHRTHGVDLGHRFLQQYVDLLRLPRKEHPPEDDEWFQVFQAHHVFRSICLQDLC